MQMQKMCMQFINHVIFYQLFHVQTLSYYSYAHNFGMIIAYIIVWCIMHPHSQAWGQ